MASKKLTYRVEQRDCIKGLSDLRGQANLVICDSPYNQGEAYDAYEDNKPYDEFLAWSRRWLKAAYDALTPDGSLWVFMSDEWVSELDMVCRHELKLSRRSWVVWSYGFGVASQKNFARSHTHILYYTKKKTRFTFNDKEVRVPSDRQLVYKDKRAKSGGKLPNNTWVLQRSEMATVLPKDGDSWYISRICGTFKERRKHSPNQLPVALLSRIILACSNPGDLVVDPFCGTGSVGASCVVNGRSYAGFDISAEAVKSAKSRIAKVS